MRPNHNEVTLIGTVGWSKLYDFAGKAFTTFSLRIKTENFACFAKISVNLSEYNRSENQALINSILSKKDIRVVLNGYLVIEKDSIVLKGTLSGLGIIANHTNLSLNKLVLSGYVDNNTLKVPYRNPKENKTLYRIIPITFSTPKPSNGDIVMVFGYLNTTKADKDGKSVDVINVTVQSQLVIEANRPARSQYERSGRAVDTSGEDFS